MFENRKAVLLGLIFVVVGISFAASAHAATNISATTTDHWAWNDVIGWMDFFNTDTVEVLSSGLKGYASSSAGDISLDCETTRNEDICGQSNYQVLNDGAGNLLGWGWNDEYGWISFCGGSETSDCPGSEAYKVWINSTTGDFNEWAWNDIVGWISFNCADVPTCGTSDYRVNTSWTSSSTTGSVDSTTYDTGVAGGAQLNSVLWHGDLPADTKVKFQFATSNSSSGPWNYVGPDGTSTTYYTPNAPGEPSRFDYTLHNDQRYFRYRVTLVSNVTQTATPRVDEVIINWSP